MDRRVLETHRIFFEEDTSEAWNSPPHVISLRGTLLDRDCTVPDTLGCDNDDVLDLPRRGDFSELGDISLSFDVRSRITEELIQFSMFRDESQRLDTGMDREAEWADFFRDYFFKPLAETTVVSDRHTRQLVQPAPQVWRILVSRVADIRALHTTTTPLRGMFPSDYGRDFG